MLYLVIMIAALGHVALCIAIINRCHGIIRTRRTLKMFDAVWYVGALGIPVTIAAWWMRGGMMGADMTQSALFIPVVTYVALCVAAAIVAVAHRAIYAYENTKTSPRLVSNHTRSVSLLEKLGYRPTQDALTTWLSRLPLNEILTLSIHRKELKLPRLDRALVGLTITHLSDLHLTGQMSKDFYREIVEESLALDSDMIVITGDIVEKVDCLDWIPELFRRLQAPLGVYYVLGNHERKIRDEASIRAACDSAGWIGLGSKSQKLEVRDREIMLAGTEMPWYGPAPTVECGPPTAQDPFRILLSHSPDQLAWAQRRHFDLMLAGHTHGGQVRFPLVGPILSPSRYGIRHAAGTFDCPPTLLHVSRGLAGTRPLRLNCPPEIAQLVLTAES